MHIVFISDRELGLLYRSSKGVVTLGLLDLALDTTKAVCVKCWSFSFLSGHLQDPDKTVDHCVCLCTHLLLRRACSTLWPLNFL